MPRLIGRSARFDTTEWSLVLAAGEGSGSAAADALARLCAAYWYPVFAFVRRQGYAAVDAQDLVQGFFTRLIDKGDLADVDRSRGRFRSFLLAACQHFLANERDRARARKRGGGKIVVPIDSVLAEGRYVAAISHDETPERLYQRQWCLTLLAAVLDDVRGGYEAAGRGILFDRLKEFIGAEAEPGDQDAAARDLGMTTGAVKVAVHRLRQRYREALRRRVADTLESPHDVEDEIRQLTKALL
jgi:DNA-directed RNA polymerase specialized sigma24 family protein